MFNYNWETFITTGMVEGADLVFMSVKPGNTEFD